MRVLQVLGSLHRGGAETMIMNYYRAFDKTKCQMDFVIHAEFENDYRKEAESMGAKIIVLPPVGKIGIAKYIRLLTQAIKENGPYDAVHAHNNYQDFLSVIAARRAGVKRIVVHSHSTRFNKVHLLVNRAVFAWGRATRVACGDKAGQAFFGKKPYIVVNNAIDVQKFVQSCDEPEAQSRENARDKLIIGHLGRFHPPKNHTFILSLAEALKRKNVKAEIHLYGEGETENEIRQAAKEKGLDDYVKFMGLTQNAAQAYRSFDVFILPSLYEGFPVVLVEAQICGLPALVADTVSRECDFELGLLKYLPLEIDAWVNELENMMRTGQVRKDIDPDILSRYDVSVQWKKLLDIYEGN